MARMNESFESNEREKEALDILSPALSTQHSVFQHSAVCVRDATRRVFGRKVRSGLNCTLLLLLSPCILGCFFISFSRQVDSLTQQARKKKKRPGARGEMYLNVCASECVCVCINGIGKAQEKRKKGHSANDGLGVRG